MATDIHPTHRPPKELEPAIQAVCLRLLTVMRKRAKDLNWAIAAHGSLVRDLDVIGIPWSNLACDEVTFVENMRLTIGEELQGECYKPEPPTFKSHGRKVYTLHVNSPQLVRSYAGAHPYVDLSIVGTCAESKADVS